MVDKGLKLAIQLSDVGETRLAVLMEPMAGGNRPQAEAPLLRPLLAW
jgi:hypothetical protein